MTQDTSTVQNPLLIIVDGLDECRDERAQCEFIELIGDHVRSSPEFPLLWLICSRPESHIKSTLSQADFQVTCRREEMLVDDKEGRQDVLLYLRGEFRDILSRYHDSLDYDWPPESHLLRIAAAASGRFAFASTVVRFVGDADTDDPSSQLRICMEALVGSRTLAGRNPYITLDHLHQHILTSIHTAIRPTTLRILGARILYSYNFRSTQVLANFLHIRKAGFYRALKPLHSVVRVHSSSQASTEVFDFYHASFAEFLRDPARSGEFYLDETVVHYDVARTALQWHTGFDHGIREDDIWIPPLENAQARLKSIKSKSLNVFWTACSRVEGGSAISMYQELLNFDFSSLGRIILSSSRFGEFLNWLSQQDINSPTPKLINSLDTYVDCDKINITQVNVLAQSVPDIIARCHGETTRIHFDLGNEERRRHMHIDTFPTIDQLVAFARSQIPF